MIVRIGNVGRPSRILSPGSIQSWWQRGKWQTNCLFMPPLSSTLIFPTTTIISKGGEMGKKCVPYIITMRLSMYPIKMVLKYIRDKSQNLNVLKVVYSEATANLIALENTKVNQLIQLPVLRFILQFSVDIFRAS